MTTTVSNSPGDIFGRRHRSFACRKVENGYVLTLRVPVEALVSSERKDTYWNWQDREYVASSEKAVVKMIHDYMLTPAEKLRVPLPKEKKP